MTQKFLCGVWIALGLVASLALTDVRQANEVINHEIVGTNPFYLVIEGARPGLLKRWDTLKLIKEFQEFLTTLPGITSSISLVDWLEVLESGINKPGSGDLIVDDQQER